MRYALCREELNVCVSLRKSAVEDLLFVVISRQTRKLTSLRPWLSPRLIRPLADSGGASAVNGRVNRLSFLISRARLSKVASAASQVPAW